MKREWNFPLGAEGSGMRFAQALGCISQEAYVRSVTVLHAAIHGGVEGTIIARRAKFDAEGEVIEDHQSKAGDYLTVAYEFHVGEETWTVEREPTFEGERSAEDFADALGINADRDFCESMVQAKCALDRFGGQLRIKPFSLDGHVAGFTLEYAHLVRGQQEEPETDPNPPGPDEEEAEAAPSPSAPPEPEGEDPDSSPADFDEAVAAEVAAAAAED